MVSNIAPKRPEMSPIICIGAGSCSSRIAMTTTTRMVCVQMRAEIGPIGSPVAKLEMAKTQPAKLKKLAMVPLIHRVQSKEPSSPRNEKRPLI